MRTEIEKTLFEQCEKRAKSNGLEAKSPGATEKMKAYYKAALADLVAGGMTEDEALEACVGSMGNYQLGLRNGCDCHTFAKNVLRKKAEPRVLTLIIKQSYFDEILLGRKTKEYREIRPSSQRKYCQVDAEGYCMYDEEKEIYLPREYDFIRFYVGYNKDRQTALVEVKGAIIELFVDEDNNPIELEEKGVPYLAAQVVYDLGAIVERPADFTDSQVLDFCQAVYDELKSMGLDEQNARGWAFGGSSESKKYDMKHNTPRQLAETYMM